MHEQPPPPTLPTPPTPPPPPPASKSPFSLFRRPPARYNPAPPRATAWFAADPSKAYFEKFSLIWAPLSMLFLLAGVFGTPLYQYCDRNTYLLITVLGCLPGVIIPICCPCPADRGVPYAQRFWVKAGVWIAIFGFFGNYFWTHYFYQLLGAQYLFDSYRFNDVPLVTYTATFFYFTFYFSFVNLLLRRINALITPMHPVLSTTLWSAFICALSYATALFEALSIQHFPLYTYTEKHRFLLIGSIVYALYFIVGFPMFFSLDETPPTNKNNSAHHHRATLGQVAQNALAAAALVTLLLDLWRLYLGSIYTFQPRTVPIPFLYQPTPTFVPTTPPAPSSHRVNLETCAAMAKHAAKGWADLQVDRIKHAVKTPSFAENVAANVAHNLGKGRSTISNVLHRVVQKVSVDDVADTILDGVEKGGEFVKSATRHASNLLARNNRWTSSNAFFKSARRMWNGGR